MLSEKVCRRIVRWLRQASELSPFEFLNWLADMVPTPSHVDKDQDDFVRLQ
jgi:hypothetical protein